MSNATVNYAVEFEHDGAKWALNIFANDWADAKRKLESLKSSAVLLGEVAETIPCANANGIEDG